MPSAAVWGIPLEELIGMNYKVTNASDDVERIYKTFNQVYRTGQPIKALTTKFVRKDGSFGVGELSAFPTAKRERRHNRLSWSQP